MSEAISKAAYLNWIKEQRGESKSSAVHLLVLQKAFQEMISGTFDLSPTDVKICDTCGFHWRGNQGCPACAEPTDVDEYECIVCEKKGCSCFSRKPTDSITTLKQFEIDVDIKEIEEVREEWAYKASYSLSARVGLQLLSKLREYEGQIEELDSYHSMLDARNKRLEKELKDAKAKIAVLERDNDMLESTLQSIKGDTP